MDLQTTEGGPSRHCYFTPSVTNTVLYINIRTYMYAGVVLSVLLIKVEKVRLNVLDNI